MVPVYDFEQQLLFEFDSPDTIWKRGHKLKVPAIHGRQPAVDDRIDLLCATYERRRGWLNYLLAQFRAQTYPHKRLIILDVSPSIYYPMVQIGRKNKDITYIWRPPVPHHNLGKQRNKLLDLVESPFFSWFDDDEFRHPYWLSDLMAEWNGQAEAITPKETYFVDLLSEDEPLRVKLYKVPTISSQSAIFTRSVAQRYRCSELYRYEEVPWLQKIAGNGNIQRVDGGWVYQLIHNGNIGNTWERVFGYENDKG